MREIDLSHHHVVTSSKEIHDICSPLYEFDIGYFCYIKIYQDHSREILTNQANWIKSFYANSFFDNDTIIEIEHNLPSGYYCLSKLDFIDDMYISVSNLFGMHNGVTFVNTSSKYRELYIFSSHNQSYQNNNFYVYNLQMFLRFIQYFRDKARYLLNEASQNKIYLPDQQSIIRKNSKILLNKINLEDKKLFIEQTKIERYYLQCEDTYLTIQETKCIQEYFKGLLISEIADKFSISSRTVETHLRNIKLKLNCITKAELHMKVLFLLNLEIV